MKAAFKNLAVSFLSLLVFLLLMEFLGRVAVFLYSHDALSFRYGFDSSVKMNMRSKKIIFIKEKMAETLNEQAGFKESAMPRSIIRIATFGGSTTYGTDIKVSSSWPAELEKILNAKYGSADKKFEVLNLAASGGNTDYSVGVLPFSKAKGKVDYILWANFVNEIDVLYFGLGRNAETLYPQFQDVLKNKKSHFCINKLTMFFKRVDLTFKKYSVFYNILYKIVHRAATHAIKIDSRAQEGWEEDRRRAKINDRLIAMGLENYRLNFMEAKRFCDENGIQLVIVRLPLINLDPEQKDISARFATIFCKALDNLMADLSRQFNAPLINAHEYYMKYGFPEDAFYDGAHQKLKGHILTAEIIAKELDGITDGFAKKAK